MIIPGCIFQSSTGGLAPRIRLIPTGTWLLFRLLLSFLGRITPYYPGIFNKREGNF
jgi:hypothetical protein